MSGRTSALALRVLLGGTLLAGGLAACDERPVVEGAGSSGPRTDPGPDDPIEFGPLPAFELVSERGLPVSLEALQGRPLVVGALFSTCTGPCPSIARGLARLQADLRETDVHIVVVSVDPEHDTPEVLARYAERVGADPERWTFLTGPQIEVYRLVREGFLMPVDRAPTGPGADPVTHDVRLLAVDRAGRRRGWYTGTDELQLERLRRRMLHLASEEQR